MQLDHLSSWTSVRHVNSRPQWTRSYSFEDEWLSTKVTLLRYGDKTTWWEKGNAEEVEAVGWSVVLWYSWMWSDDMCCDKGASWCLGGMRALKRRETGRLVLVGQLTGSSPGRQGGGELLMLESRTPCTCMFMFKEKYTDRGMKSSTDGQTMQWTWQVKPSLRALYVICWYMPVR